MYRLRTPMTARWLKVKLQGGRTRCFYICQGSIGSFFLHVVKLEMEADFPGKLGLYNEQPRPKSVILFYDLLKKCDDEIDLAKRWFMHEHPQWMVLRGEDFVDQFGPWGELDRLGMTGIWRALNWLENKMYRGGKNRWRAIPDPNLMVEIMMKDHHNMIDFECVRRMLCEEYTGYNLRNVEQLLMLMNDMESWSVYAVNLKMKKVVIMDPSDCNADDSTTKDRHWRNLSKFLKGLIHCINECFPGWEMTRQGWQAEYKYDLHERCSRLLLHPHTERVRWRQSR
ncbi:uncharacterized protein LOC125519485 isoform X2 [Triticum urartu]|nr:uncharacterized protein LOC125519485 isoform X2 [Triticum urartu]